MGGGFLQQVAKISHIHRMSLRCYGPNRNQERKKKSETHFRAWGGRKVFFFFGGGVCARRSQTWTHISSFAWMEATRLFWPC